MSQRLITIPAALAAALALAAPAGAIPGQDWRSPDARDAGQPVPVLQDLRSPDARDVAVRASHPIAPARVVSVSADGFDWGDAAIGAGGAAGAVLLLAGAGIAVTRRQPPRQAAS